MKRLFVVLLMLVAITTAEATEKFRYKFAKGDSIDYSISIDSRFYFPELGGLASLLNLEGTSQNIEIMTELAIDSVDVDGRASVRAVFRNISMVAVAGDSVFTDDGSSWGAINPGSEYNLIIDPDGEIIDAIGPDSVAVRQGVELMQRLFTVFPDVAIEEGYRWSDSLTFDVEVAQGKSVEISCQITYIYVGKDSDLGGIRHRFDYTVGGVSDDGGDLRLTGDGFFYFDENGGRITENSGAYNIDALIGLAAFGLPQGFGNGIRVNIKSDVLIKSTNER